MDSYEFCLCDEVTESVKSIPFFRASARVGLSLAQNEYFIKDVR